MTTPGRAIFVGRPGGLFRRVYNGRLVGLAYEGPSAFGADADCEVNIYLKEGSTTENVGKAKVGHGKPST
jgi:hypothetical protein